MKRTARKVGNSMTISIPTFIISKLKIKEGEKLDVDIQGEKIVIQREIEEFK